MPARRRPIGRAVVGRRSSEVPEAGRAMSLAAARRAMMGVVPAKLPDVIRAQEDSISEISVSMRTSNILRDIGLRRDR
ncbi:hypothetical protein FOHLNKBM_4578 [Methylobacterium longum]|nr:hypothetical protein FOHLNKBM_4578 [Methylobacterium longum]